MSPVGWNIASIHSFTVVWFVVSVTTSVFTTLAPFSSFVTLFHAFLFNNLAFSGVAFANQVAFSFASFASFASFSFCFSATFCFFVVSSRWSKYLSVSFRNLLETYRPCLLTFLPSMLRMRRYKWFSSDPFSPISVGMLVGGWIKSKRIFWPGRKLGVLALFTNLFLIKVLVARRSFFSPVNSKLPKMLIPNFRWFLSSTIVSVGVSEIEGAFTLVSSFWLDLI